MGGPMGEQLSLNIALSVALTLVVESSRGLWIPSITHSNYAAGGTAFTLAALISFKSIGRFISFLWMGHYTEKFGIKLLYQISCALNLLGSVMFAYAFQANNIWLMIAARTVTGLGGGVLAPIRAYISRVTDTEDRFFYMGILTAAQYFGFTICPVMALGFYLLAIPGSAIMSEDTAPAWILTVISAGLWMMISVAFHEDDIGYEAIEDRSEDQAAETQDELQPLQRRNRAAADDDDSDEEDPRPATNGVRGLMATEAAMVVTIGVLLYMYLNFVSRGVIAMSETVSTTTYKELYHLKPQELIRSSAFFYGKAGIIGYGVFLFMLVCAKRWVHEGTMLVFAFSCLTVGLALLAFSTWAHSVAAFDVGFLLVWSLGFPIKQTCLMSSFSKLLGDRPQGPMQGYIGTVGAAGRTIFPFLVTMLSLPAVFGICMVMCFTAFVALIWYMGYSKKHLAVAPRKKEEVIMRRVVQITNKWASRKAATGQALAGTADVYSSDGGGRRGDELVMARARALEDGPVQMTGYISGGGKSDGGGLFQVAFEQAKRQLEEQQRKEREAKRNGRGN